MTTRSNILFRHDPLAVLVAALLLIITTTGIMIFFLGDTLNDPQQEEFALLTDPVNVLPASNATAATDSTPDMQQLVSYIDTNFYAMPSRQLRDLINDVLIMEPDNRDALLLAAKLAERDGNRQALVAATRSLYRIYPSQAYLYSYAKALHDNNQSDQAYDVLLLGRETGIYSPLLDLLAAELAIVNEVESDGLANWIRAGAPEIKAAEYPFLAEYLVESGHGGFVTDEQN